jgi:hypothetical protein
MPTPIPALAPVDSPESGLVSVIPLTSEPSGPVLIADGADVPLAQYKRLPEFVQIEPVLQQPPPRVEAQLNCPVVQPLGRTWTSVVGATDVETHWLLLAHENPRLQHPPPYAAAH